MVLNRGLNTMGGTPTGERVDEGENFNRVGSNQQPQSQSVVDVVNRTRENIGIPPIDSTKK